MFKTFHYQTVISSSQETFSGEQKETRQNNESELKITKEVEEFSEGKAQDIEIQSQMKQGNRVAYERGEDVWHDSSRLEPLGDVELPEKSLKKDFKKKEIDIHL